ncbi:MAG: hypothetical protein QOG15_1947 [Solirubrobacteraceae bacterium]|jgi:PAS domain S-box-containing protein|nr:hypothetical protein [Solirubrobacteraceae bacterium]
MPSDLIAERFHATRVLRDGGDITTYLGTDVEDGRRVVIKAAALDAVSRATQAGLEHQAEVLVGLEQLSVTGPAKVWHDDERLYVVTPFVPGVPLSHRLERGALPVAESIAIGRALMTALAAAHERDVLHLDVKPSNLMVDEFADPLRATLLDFGFSRNSHLDERVGELPAAAAHYLSPEQAGLLHREIDERSDLYSAGAVLFACLAARPPFEGASVGDVLSRIVAARAPRLRSLREDVPRALEQVVERLLQPDPNDRYQSAEAAARDLDHLARAIAAGDAEPPLLIGVRDRGRRTLTEPVLVGRADELRTLEHELERVRAGGRAIVTLEAESGGGKTRLLEELAELCAGRSVLTLRGQGLDQSGQAPYQMLEGVVDGIIARTATDRPFAEVLRHRLGDHEAALTAALPRLSQLLGRRGASEAGLEEHGQLRTTRALRILLDALGTARQPALVLLDDCQWADEMTLRLLREWHALRDGPGGEGQHVLVVCAFRSEEVAADHPLRRLRGAVSIALRPFGPEDVQNLIDSMTGGVPSTVAGVVSRLSEGSPFMATEILRGLVETGVLKPDPDGWQAELQELEDAQSSRRAAEVFGRRLERLDGAVLELLSVGAILGKRFDVATAGALAEQTSDHALSGLSEARNRRIVWLQDDGATCAFVHDKLRETLLARLSDSDRAALHLAAALHLEQRDATQVFDIAYHFDAAGEPKRALHYALAAADNARRRHALELADRQYRIAERGAPPDDALLRSQIAEGQADVAMLRGRYEEAAEHLDTARASVGEGLMRARLEGKVGELAFKRGDVHTARDATEHALRLLGARVPRRTFTFLVFMLWEVAVQFAHSAAPRLVRRRRPDDEGADLLAVRLYSRLAHVYWFGAGKVPCGWTHLRGLNRAERYPPTLELAQGYSEHAPVMTMLPWFKRGLDYAGRSLAIRRELGDAWGEGQSLHFTGVALYGASRYEDALETLHAAIAILERTGDQWEVNTASWHVALSLYRLGRLSEAVEVAERVHRTATELGDDQASGIALGVWGKASLGQAPIERAVPPGDDVHTRAELLQGQAVGLLARGLPSHAVAALRDADAAIRAKGMRQEYVAPVLPWLATALRSELEATPALAPRRRRQLKRQAARAARRAHRVAHSYRNNLPHALRERALVAALGGRPRRALKLLGESAAIAEAQGATYELAQTHLARAQLDEALGVGDGDTVESAQRAIDAITAGVTPVRDADVPADEATLSLADRFSTLLDEGRRIALALTREGALAASRQAAMTLLRGERCVVVELTAGSSGSRVPVPSAGSATTYDVAAVRRALTAGRPVTIEEPLASGASAQEVRSAICAPIFMRGEAVACLYATHGHVGALFGEQEERLAAFICSLAGAALENAEGFAVAERLSRSLERRVEERTAELTASQEDMRETLSLLSATLESTADGILVVSRDGAIVSHNRKFGEMWGIPQELLDTGDDDSAIAFVLDQLAAPEDFVAQVQRLYRLPEAESHDELDFKDGRVYERHSLPQRVDGETIGRVWSFRDVTAQKRILRELQELDRIKSDFVSTVSHELRTPLTSITGYVEMLRDGDGGELSKAQDRMLEVVEFNTGRLLAQIEDLLTLSRIESGTYQLAHAPMAVAPIIRAVAEAIMPQATARELELRLEIPDELPDLLGDARELDRALLNLASNAVKFTRPGGQVTISAECVGDDLQIAVTDTGVGIPADEQDQLFTRFFRSSTTTREAIQGTGLGLVIVKGIVDHHGGHIDVHSVPGTGTRIVVTLPTGGAERTAV